MSQSNCLQCHNPIVLQAQELELRKKLSPVINDYKYDLPEPKFCFVCRLQRRLMWRNDRNLYSRKCDKSGELLISMFHPEAKAVVWQRDLWWADDWDVREYGRAFDFERGFFEQFLELLQSTPMPNVMTLNSENSLYTNYNMANNNCYLCFAGNYLEDSLYCYNAQNSRDCMDCLFVLNSELCYECIHCEDSYNLKYSIHSKSCRDSAFLEDCVNCRDCFMCWNLRGAQYCFMNKQYTKEEYFKLVSQYDLASYKVVKDVYDRWLKERILQMKPQFHNLNHENCSGDYLNGSKNCHNCYMTWNGAEDCCNVFQAYPGLKDALDCTYSGENGELMYESIASGSNTRSIYFSHIGVDGSENIFYASFVFNSKNCFGSVGLRNAQYCILNKQYTKEEYFKLVPLIIEHMSKTGEWGEFFPHFTSFFAYNQSVAQDYLPLTKEQALAKNFSWYEKGTEVASQDSRVNDVVEIPDNIKDASSDLVNSVLRCELTGKAYKLTVAEIAFCKKMNVALPRLQYEVRHQRRMALKNPYHFYRGRCFKCSKEISTTFDTTKFRRVACESCYLTEVY